MPKFKKAGSSPLLKKTVSWTTPSDVKEAIKPSNTTCGCGIDCDYGYLSLINFSAGCEKESSAIFISDGQINVGSFSDVKEAVDTCCSGTEPSNPCADCEDYINGVCVQRCLFCETCVNGNCVSNCDVCAECTINGCQAKDCGPCETCVNGNCVFPCLACEQCDANEQCISTCGPCSQCTVNGCVAACGPCEDCINGVCTPRCTGCEACVNDQCVYNCGQCESCINGECVFPLCTEIINGECTPTCPECLNDCSTGICKPTCAKFSLVDGLCKPCAACQTCDTVECICPNEWDRVGFYNGTLTCSKDRDCGIGYACMKVSPGDVFGTCIKIYDYNSEGLRCSNSGDCAEKSCLRYDGSKPNESEVGCSESIFVNTRGCPRGCAMEYSGAYGSFSETDFAPCVYNNTRCVPSPTSSKRNQICQAIYDSYYFYYDDTLKRCNYDPNA